MESPLSAAVKPGALPRSTLRRGTDECVVQRCCPALSTADSSLLQPARNWLCPMGGVKRCPYVPPRVCTLVLFIMLASMMDVATHHSY